MPTKFATREQLINLADRYNVSRYGDGRIDKIDAFLKGKKIHTTQAVYSTTEEGLKRLTDIQGLLFPEVWNSIETPELNWYDRNPTNIFLTYYSNLGVHAKTDRWTYQVPAGRKFFCEILQANIVLTTLDAGGGTVEIDIGYTPQGGVESLLYSNFITPEVLKSSYISAGQSFLLFEGDSITARTMNIGTGGSFTFGRTSIGGSQSQDFQPKLSQYTPVSDGTLQYILAYISGSGAGKFCKAGLYSDNAGYPANLLAESAVDEITVDGWHTFSTLNYPVTSGTPYWLATYSDNIDLTIAYDAGGAPYSTTPSSFPTFPDPYPLYAYTSNDDVSIYAQCVGAGGGGNAKAYFFVAIKGTEFDA